MKTSPSNKRIFQRYSLNLDCVLMVSGKTLDAVAKDFSLSGLGIFIKDAQAIEAPLVNIKVQDIHLDTEAKIVWTHKMFSGLRCGINKIGTFAGRLKHYRLADILIGLKKSGRTGVLEVNLGSSLKKIYFQQGNVIFSSSDQESERMGDMLLDMGKINKEQYDKSVEFMIKTGKRQGAALVELGYLTPAELIWAVRYQVEKIIHNLFKADKGSFIFKDEPLPISELITLQLSTADLIYRGIKSLSGSDKTINIFPSFDEVLYIYSDPSTQLQQVVFDENDRKMLMLIDGKRTIKEIISLSPINELETIKTLSAFFNTQLVNIAGQNLYPISLAGDEDEMPEEKTAESVVEQADESIIVDKIEKMYRECKQFSYHGILNISKNASQGEIKRAYHGLAKEFHPDKYLHLQSASLREKLNFIFAHINEAYRMLTQSRNEQHSDQGSAVKKETADNRELAKMRFNEARSTYGKGLFEQAMTLLGQAIYLDNSISDYHFYYGKALLKNKKIKDAEESIKKAIQLSPFNSDYITELGYIYLQLGFKTRAKNTFEKALKYNPAHELASAGLEKITP